MNKIYSILIRWRSGLLVFLTHNMALPVLRYIRRPKPFPYSAAELHELPLGTLGKDLINFLEARQLQLMPHYAKHDMKHILLDYDTTDEGEVCLQSFMLGNRHLSFPVAATVLYGFATMPEHWTKFIAAFKRGRKSIRIARWNWFGLLHQPTFALIAQINTPPNDSV
jgi:ubiquinone biosynthesis protein Coq4